MPEGHDLVMEIQDRNTDGSMGNRQVVHLGAPEDAIYARYLDASGTPIKGGGQTTGLLPPRHRHQPLRLQPLRRHPPIPPNQPSVTPTPTTSLCILTGDTPPRSRPAGATTTAATSRQSSPSNAPPPPNPPPSTRT